MSEREAKDDESDSHVPRPKVPPKAPAAEGGELAAARGAPVAARVSTDSQHPGNHGEQNGHPAQIGNSLATGVARHATEHAGHPAEGGGYLVQEAAAATVAPAAVHAPAHARLPSGQRTHSGHPARAIDDAGHAMKPAESPATGGGRMAQEEASNAVSRIATKVLALQQALAARVSRRGSAVETLLVMGGVALLLLFLAALAASARDSAEGRQISRPGSLAPDGATPAVIPFRTSDTLMATSSPAGLVTPKIGTPTLLGNSYSMPVTAQSTQRSALDAALSMRGSEFDAAARSARPLCAGLVVPPGSECLLAVPMLRSCGMPPQHEASFTVRDLKGVQVVACEARKPEWSESERTTIMILKGVSSRDPAESVPSLAFCQVGPFLGDQKCVMVQDAMQRPFASLVKDPKRPYYAMSCVGGGSMVLIDGNFAEMDLTIMDERQVTIADVQQCPMEFGPDRTDIRLRANPKADVGLLLCALVSVQLMEMC